MSCMLDLTPKLRRGFPALTGLLLASTVALAGCGGGGGGSEAGIVAIPPPPASPTSGFANASSTSVGYRYTGRAEAPAKLSDERWSITYDPGSQTYSFHASGGGEGFGPATSKISSTSDFRTYYNPPAQTDVYKTESWLDVLRTGSDGAGNTRIRLNYLSYALWSSSAEEYGDTNRFVVWGTPTAASDMPRTGTATYAGIVDGYYGANRLLDSTGTLSADFANGTISTQLALRTSGLQHPLSGSSAGAGFEIGTLSGSGTIGSGTNSYQGTLAGSLQGTAVTGTLTGLFFGPGAVETGFSFGVNSTAFGTENNVAAVGAFVGKQ